MTCKQCNSEIGNNRFCPQCGTDNSVAPVQQPVQPQYNAPQEPVFTVETNAPAYNTAEPVMPNYTQEPVAPAYEQPATPTYEQPATPAYDAYAPQNAPQAQDNPYSAYAPNNASTYGNPAPAYNNNGYNAGPEDYSKYMPQNNYAQQQYAPQGNGYAAPAMEDPGKSKATAALIWGILSLFFGWIPGIVALVMASKYDKVGNGVSAGTAKTGKIMGIIGIVLGAICSLLVLLLGGAFIALIGAAVESASILPMFL